MENTFEIQEVFLPLLTQKKRYKLYYGGRGGGKSYAFADALLLISKQKTCRILCVREVQNSIKDSVYQLLKDRAEYINQSIEGFNDFVFYEDRIECSSTGSVFIFKGMNDTNSQNVKSLEGVNYVWCEEAQNLSDNSLKILIPTIRKEGSEIWFSMNRLKELDPVWKAVAVNAEPERCLIRKVNYYDNKYCPQVLIDEAEDMKKKDYLGYLHVWEGEPEQQSDRKLIPLVDVKKALNNLSPYESTNLPLIIGVDPARFGDDKTAIARRRGRMAYKIHSYAKLSVVDVANLIKNIIIEENPAIVNIDSGGLGAGICDILIADGFGDVVRAVNFGEKAQDIERFANRRAEMWCRIRDWLAGDLPVSLTDCEGLSEDLTTPFKNFDKIGRLILEPKDDIKKRIGRSTDVADALALTFAEREYPMWLTTRSSSLYEYVDTNIYVE